MVERSTVELRVAGSMPARKYLYDIHLVVAVLVVCVCEFKCL